MRRDVQNGEMGSGDFLFLALDVESGVSLHRQLYEGLRRAILEKRLVAGTRLPATRVMAQNVGVSRTTVLNAFEQLLAEGYVEGRVGSGTYVARVLPEDLLQLKQGNVRGEEEKERKEERASRGMELSERGRRIVENPVMGNANAYTVKRQAFRPGVPALEEFPFGVWSKLVAKHWKNAPYYLFGYSDPAGYYPLREAVAGYVEAARGVRCVAEQVIIVAGSQQAINLAAQILIDPGDEVWIEDPCYRGTRSALVSVGAQLVAVGVDEEGMVVEKGIAKNAMARMACVTPSHQFPLGGTMSLARRLALLQWAEQAGAWIVEDDYDGEYRYRGRPLASLQGLDTGGRVIYVGTFSKVLMPALRLGYVVVPPMLVDAFTAARATADRQTPIMEQLVLTDFITEEHFARHVRRMRALYEERQGMLLEILQRIDPEKLRVQASDAGMHLVGHLPEEMKDVEVVRRLEERRVVATALSRYCVEETQYNGLLLGYTACDREEMEKGVRVLERMLSEGYWK